METIVCIECPNGCELEVEKVNGEITVRKNRCKRGVDFAKAELLNPKRTISSTVKTVFSRCPGSSRQGFGRNTESKNIRRYEGNKQRLS